MPRAEAERNHVSIPRMSEVQAPELAAAPAPLRGGISAGLILLFQALDV
jgi:hypothetical protein